MVKDVFREEGVYLSIEEVDDRSKSMQFAAGTKFSYCMSLKLSPSAGIPFFTLPS